MDPAIALPLHFTIETAFLVAAGLVFAWAVLQKEWVAAVGAAAVLIAQVVHAGQFVASDGGALVVILRLAGLLALGVATARVGVRPRLLAAGLAVTAAGVLWTSLVGGTAADLSVAPHVLIFLGASALIVWVWQASRPSVRLRVLSAFVSVLAVAVVVAGGAVARVAAVGARTDEYSRLGRNSALLANETERSLSAVSQDAATLSPVLSLALARGEPVEVSESQVPTGGWVVVLDRSGRGLSKRAAEGIDIPFDGPALAVLEPVRSARSGGPVSSDKAITADSLVTYGAAPVYRAGSDQVAGAVVVGISRTAADFRRLLGDPTLHVAISDAQGSMRSDASVVVPRTQPAGSQPFFERIGSGDDRWYVAVVGLRGGGTVAVAARDDAIIDAATDLVRAFLVAIMAAAALAVVAALWLSARITRPLLDLADEAERVKTDFLASISHELRTPLTPIRGYTEILRGGRVPARESAEYLDEIGTATQRLERIVSLLVDVAAIEAGRFVVDRSEVDPEELLNARAEAWKDRSPKHAISVHTPPSLPEVSADPGAIGRVLDELIDNAVKFSPGGDIELRAENAGRGVEFAVHDEGPGMDPERIAAAKAAFTQADTGDTRRFGGLGLGLSFANGVLRTHGVPLTIVSEPGQGTTCSFPLPAAGSVTRMPAKAAARKR